MKTHSYIEKLYTDTFDLITKERSQMNQMITDRGLKLKYIISDILNRFIVPHGYKYRYSIFLSYKKYCMKKRICLSKKYTSRLETVLSYLIDEESKRVFEWMVCFKAVRCLLGKPTAEKLFP